MDTIVQDLTKLVRNTVAEYVTPSLGSTLHFVENAEKQLYAVLVEPENYKVLRARAIVAAQVIGHSVVIIEDITDHPLYESLLRAGIPRERLILKYAGESFSENEAL